MITPDEARADYREMISERGEEIFLRRYSGTVDRSYHDTKVMAAVMGSDAQELAGATQQYDRLLIVLAQDLEEAQFALPVLATDFVVIEGKQHAISNPDRFTRRIQGVVIAYELKVRGP